MGRRKEWDARIVLPLTSAMLDRIAEAAPDVDRVAFIREAIELELARRETKGPPKFPATGHRSGC